MWVLEGVAVWLVALPLAAFVMRDSPAELGQRTDGHGVHLPPAVAPWGVSLRRALRQPFFVVLVAGVAVSGTLVTAVSFHQISLLSERGLSPTAAAANVLPQTLAGIAATLVVGALVDRVDPRWLMGSTMATLALGLVWGVVVTAGISAIGFGMAIGAAGAAIRAVETAAVPRFFDTVHTWVHTWVRCGASSPQLRSARPPSGRCSSRFPKEAAGTYRTVLLASALAPLAVLVAAALARPPSTPAREPVPQE